MERKISRRGPHPEHSSLPLNKTMIGQPTNFFHVGHSYQPQDRYGECEETEVVRGLSLKECPAQARQVGVQGRDTEGEGQEQEGDQGGQGEGYDAPLSPTSRRNSRRISKDMISLPRNFRHVLHIDPTTADPEHLSLLLKGGTDFENDLEEYEGEDEQEDPAWSPQEPHTDQQETQKEPPEPPPKPAKPNRPASSRVRKSMISLPTNFQHVNHISVGERLNAPESPPPQFPPEPDPGEEEEEEEEKEEEEEEGEERVQTFYHEQTTTTNTPFNYDIPATHHSPIPPPLTLPPIGTPHPPAPLSAPPHIETTREENHLSGSGHYEHGLRMRRGDTDFDFDHVQFRVPPPPCRNGHDIIRSSLPQPRTYNEFTEEEGRRGEGEEGEGVVVQRGWRRDGRERDRRGLSWKDRCQEERRPLPLDAPPRLPSVPPAVSRRRSIGRPTNFQHVGHLDAEAADRLLEECMEEREGEKRRGRERERERSKERRTPSLPPALPHLPPALPPAQDIPPSGKLRKAMIGHPTNFQHVAHVGFGGGEGGH